MEKTPVIFFAFANDEDAHLPLLKEEVRILFEELEEYDRHEYIKMHRKENSNLKDIFAGFTRYKDQVVIFHYGGHAGGNFLQLEDGGGNAEGLAQLIGEQQNLRLVFLNGCSTKAQVDLLFEKGVKAVIATSVKIKDNLAVEFAQQFYNSLANRRTIGQAFNIAEAYIKAQPDSDGALKLSRGIKLRKTDEEAVEDDMAWALYVNPENEDEVIHWQLPYYKSLKFSSKIITLIKGNFKSNQFIVQHVLQEMCRYNPDIYKEIEDMDSSRFPWQIINQFPWPIGAQIAELFKKENMQADQQRLDHLVSTYIITSKMLYYILLSDLWNISRSSDNKIKWKDTKMKKEDYATYDYWGNLNKLYQTIMKHDTPFVPEFNGLINQLETKGSKMAHEYLEDLRTKILEGSTIENLEDTCLKAEQALSQILRLAAFLSRYRMLTVRHVGIERERFSTETYELDMGQLHADSDNQLSLYNDEDRRKKTSYSDSNSIVLVANENQLDKSLNLSPLIIDKNTYTQINKGQSTHHDTMAHIFMSAWYDSDKLYYIDIRHSFFTALNKSSDQIHTEMTHEDFLEGSNIKESAEDEWNFGLEEEEETETVAGTKVFQLLHDQYEMFHSDMN